ncbi:YwmB family TATA-box binding protein [Alicyclobacillus mali]|uniref:YwmB family TATA-box binding protein n=1 Tax=Alicyclobacillus mali (ex Roth et al. 2021) TaxID=1123961 RepID=A0ABS0F0X2_9BACL|nr:YwmB family TATA-box binding protein [Alicyclobacillus mali (ex Roth et al. 2021)]MBF8376928.1 YwmB family TATA-box binding protein [Alicyclobacillus mali (ex Roth et al. 2021)]
MAHTKVIRRARLVRRRGKKAWKRAMWLALWIGLGAVIAHPPGTASAETSTSAQSDGAQQYAFLMSGLRATGTSPSSYLIHDWTQLNASFLNEAQLTALGAQVVQELGIADVQTQATQLANETYWRAAGVWPGGTRAEVILTSFPGATSGAGDGQPETVMTVTASSSNLTEGQFSSQYDQVERTVASVNGTPQMSAYIAGFKPSEVSEAEADGMAIAALRAVGAGVVEGIRTPLETSLSGYSARVPVYVLSGDHRRVNVQVAVHDDSFRRGTDVYVGSPLVIATY